MNILGEVGGTQAFLTIIVAFLLIPFTYERHQLKVYKEFQETLAQENHEKCKHGHKHKRKACINEHVTSKKMLIHDAWTGFKKCLHSIKFCKNRINVESEIWPGLHEANENIAKMLASDFDL